MQTDKDIVQAIIGSKCDMVDERETSYEEAYNLAMSIGAQYFEVSAKENINIDTALTNLIEATYKKFKEWRQMI